MELCFHYISLKIEGCLASTLTGAVTFNSNYQTWDRQTDRQTEKQTDRQAGRQAGRDRDRETDQNISKIRSFYSSI